MIDLGEAVGIGSARRALIMNTTDAPLLERAAGRFSAALGEVASEVASACRAEIPSYATLDTSGVEEVESAFAEHAHVLTKALVDRRSLSTDELGGLSGLGHRRFEQGLPLHDLVAGYQVGMRVALEYFLIHLKAIPSDPTENAITATEVTRHTLKITAQATAAIARAYLGAQSQAGRPPPDAGSDLSWLGSDQEPDRIDACLRNLGFTPTVAHIVCLLTVDEPETEDTDPILAIRSQLEVALRFEACGLLFGRANGCLVLVAGMPADGARAAWLTESLASLVTPEGPGVKAAIGEVSLGLEGIQRSYRQALQVMELLEGAAGLNQ